MKKSKEWELLGYSSLLSSPLKLGCSTNRALLLAHIFWYDKVYSPISFTVCVLSVKSKKNRNIGSQHESCQIWTGWYVLYKPELGICGLFCVCVCILGEGCVCVTIVGVGAFESTALSLSDNIFPRQWFLMILAWVFLMKTDMKFTEEIHAPKRTNHFHFVPQHFMSRAQSPGWNFTFTHIISI